MENYFIKEKFTEEQSAFLHGLVDLGRDFMDGKVRNNRVLQYAENEVLRGLVSEALPDQGLSLENLFLEIKEKVLPYSISQADMRFLAFPDTGNSFATIAADIIASFINQNLIAIDRSAPVATFIEIQTLLWLRGLIGYTAPPMTEVKSLSQVGGMWTPGGNLSNCISVLAALHHHFPDVRKNGIHSLKKKPVIVVASGIDHFSFSNSAMFLGLGSDGILWVDANENYQTDISSLEKTLDNCPDHLEPFMVVSVAGNCRTTGIDDLQRIRAICDSRKLWMHVDACHGGSLLFSSKLRETMLTGIERADSVSLDPHKGLFLTYPASYVLFRNPVALAALSRYPDKTKEEGLFDLGLITPFLGSRGFQSLKMWLLIKHLGLSGLEQAIESRQAVNWRLTEVLQETGLFVLLHENKFYRQAFVFCPTAVLAILKKASFSEAEQKAAREIISYYSKKFNSILYESGEVVFDAYQMQDLGNQLNLGSKEKYSVISMSIGHAYMNPEIIANMKDKMVSVGETLASSMLKDMEQLKADATVKKVDQNSEGPAGW